VLGYVFITFPVLVPTLPTSGTFYSVRRGRGDRVNGIDMFSVYSFFMFC
jgi:hypothetical protein